MPPQLDDEINLLQNYTGLLKEIIYPKGKYFIRNYNDHYKNTVVKINLILPKYDIKGIKIKTINKDHYINKSYNSYITELPSGFNKNNMQMIVYKENGFEVTNNYIVNRIKIYIKNKKKNKKKSNRNKSKRIQKEVHEIIKKNITEKDIDKDDEKTYCLNMEFRIINKKYGLEFDFIEKEIKKIMEQRNKAKEENRNPNLTLLILKKINEIFNREINKEINDFLNNIKKNKHLYDKYHILIDSFVKDSKYLLKFYINDYNYFENNFKSLVIKYD